MVVLFAVATALTLLPALLSLLGDRIDAGRVIGRRRPAKPAEDTAWWRLRAPHLAPAVAVPGRRVGRAADAGRPGAGAEDRLPERRRQPDRARPNDGPTTCWPTASGPASTPRCSIVADLRGTGVDAGSIPALSERIAADPGIATVGEPQVSARRRHHRVARDPHHGAKDPATRRPWTGPRPHAGRGLRDRADRADQRPHQAAVRHPAAVHRRDPGRVVPAADGGVPLGRWSRSRPS